MGAPDTLGLIAGQGQLPFELARAAQTAGRRVTAIALRGFADAALESAVESCHWLAVGELDALLRTLAKEGAREAVLVGTVAKDVLFAGAEALRLDARAAALLAGLSDRGDDAILRAIAAVLEAEGIRVVGQGELAPELLAPRGPLGRVTPTAAQLDDVAFAWPLAKAVGQLDFGQTVVVRERTVLAVEAIEGTDAAIRRGGALGREGAVVVKVCKPTQDPRFDLPAIGPATLESLRAARASLLAVEAGRTLVVERERFTREADALGICVLGVADPADAGKEAP